MRVGETLRDSLPDWCGGNAQGFRVLTQLEYHQFDGGTRLTYATLGSYLKYPWSARHADALGYKKHKFGSYQSELWL